MNKYIDRQEAGVILARELVDYAHKSDVIILALPRGGVPVAYEIAVALQAPLDVFIVRKLGLPGHEEFAIGAIASGNTMYLNQEFMHQLHINQSSIENIIEKEQEELVRREHVYRGNKPFPKLTGKTVILVDDGIATGATMRAAIEALRKFKPKSIIIAVPVAARSTCDEMNHLVDRLICPLRPIDFYAVGLWYEQFPQTSDSEVIALLKKSPSLRAS